MNNQPSYQNSQIDNSSEDNNEYRYGGYMYAGGGGINIKPSHEGLFSQAAKAHGMSVQQYAASILRNKDNHNATLIKRMQITRNQVVQMKRKLDLNIITKVNKLNQIKQH